MVMYICICFFSHSSPSLIDCHEIDHLHVHTGCFVVVSLPFNTDVCSCINTPAHLYLLASVNIVYGLEVSGYF